MSMSLIMLLLIRTFDAAAQDLPASSAPNACALAPSSSAGGALSPNSN